MQFEHAWGHVVSKTLFLSQELVFQLYSQTGQKRYSFYYLKPEDWLCSSVVENLLSMHKYQINKQQKEWEEF
ncbi:hypothetical protein ACRRTK_017625 [Alexandromys fortis]